MYRKEIVMMVVRTVIGIGLSLLAFMNLPSLELSDNAAIYTYISSPWMIPTVLICYGIVILVDNVIAYHIRKKYNQWQVRSYSVA
ncbi:hypothetical protein V1508DRAFT_426713 [Lipomyces doorenjongii]|uniref:uncharacterized protein n=1 Tax=Lipomyces doorenjongii TaxID=383834 RepID=UPI0034D0037D